MQTRYQEREVMGKLQQPVHLTVFHLFGLILAGVCASGLAKDGWAERGYVGLLGGLILGALAAPIIFFLGFVLSLLGLLSLVFIDSSGTRPFPDGQR
jgi:hypothetical protein